MMVRDAEQLRASRRRPACSSRAISPAIPSRRARRAGFLHFVEDVDRAPIEVRYGRSGVLWMSAGPGRVERGDAVAVVMEDYDDLAPDEHGAAAA